MRPGYERLINSAERLDKLLKLDAPENIVAIEIALILHKAYALFGKEMADAHGRWLTEQARMWAGLCTQCGKRIEGIPIHTMDSCCKACHEEFKKEILGDPEDADLVEKIKKGPS